MMDGSMAGDARAMREKEKAQAEAELYKTAKVVGEARRPPVIEQLDYLSEGISYLGDVMVTLEEKIGIILSPVYDGGEKDGSSSEPMPSRGELTEGLELQNNRLRRIIRQVQELTNRVEL